MGRPEVSGIDAITTLRHFAIVTYAVPPERVRGLIHPRFELDCVTVDGRELALLSVVPFEDQDFRAAAFPSPRLRFGQTNYRLYIRDRESGDRAVWFLGTTLGSWTVAVPRFLWKLPWHPGRFRFACEQGDDGRYSRYRIETGSRWASALIDLEDLGMTPTLPGFSDLEAGLVVLTHPLTGYYFRRDGRLGTYSVWHERLAPTAGRIRDARFDLLDRLNIVPRGEQRTPHSVLMQPRTEFIVKLPPGLC